jgi:hypothetical protein
MLISVEGRSYHVGRIEGVRPRDRVMVCKVVLDADAEMAPIRVTRLDGTGEPVGSSHRIVAVSIDARGRYTEPAMYRDDVADAVDLQREAEERSLDAVAIPPTLRPADAGVPKVALPEVASVIAPRRALSLISNREARDRLTQMLGQRELSDGDAMAIAHWGVSVDPMEVVAMARSILAARSGEPSAQRAAEAW